LPNQVLFKPFKHIIYATNYNKADIPVLKKLSAFAKLFNAEITALHVTDSLDFEEKVKNMGFKNILKEKTNYPINVQVLVEQKNEDTSAIINSFAKSANADIIVMLKQNKSFFERVFKGSATKKLINKTNLPVLIYHA
jgi:nucleotide-binding universal stress UspA family protein